MDTRAFTDAAANRLMTSMEDAEVQVVSARTRWYQLILPVPPYRVEPKTYVLPMPGGLLVRVALPASPMVFVPNVELSDLVDSSD